MISSHCARALFQPYIEIRATISDVATDLYERYGVASGAAPHGQRAWFQIEVGGRGLFIEQLIGTEIGGDFRGHRFGSK